MKLTEQKRDDLKSLLKDHQEVTDALFNLPKSAFTTTLIVHDEENNDLTEVELHKSTAKETLLKHKAWVVAELAKLGIEIS